MIVNYMPLPSVCTHHVSPWSSRACRLGTRGCTGEHTSTDLEAEYCDAQTINRTLRAVEELSAALAAAGGDLIPREGRPESAMARAALDSARAVLKCKPSTLPTNINHKE